MVMGDLGAEVGEGKQCPGNALNPRNSGWVGGDVGDPGFRTLFFSSGMRVGIREDRNPPALQSTNVLSERRACTDTRSDGVKGVGLKGQRGLEGFPH